MKARRFRFHPQALLVMVLTGCVTVGPDFVPPKATLPDQYSAAKSEPDRSAAPQIVTGSATDWRWWRSFNDAALDDLEERSVAGNLDLQAAVLRIAVSRSQVQIARAQGVPSLNAQASATREQLGLAGILKAEGSSTEALTSSPAGRSLVSTLTEPVNIFQIGFDASWELDLFGRVGRSVEAADAQSVAAIESRNDALISLEAEVAQTYLQVRAAQSLHAITVKMLSDADEILKLTRNRHASGLSNQSDVEAASAQLSSIESQLPPYELTIAQGSHALAVLAGQLPGSLDARIEDPASMPPVPAVIPVGVPASLARRRPDIRFAEANLHAATADIGVSIAELYPDISLTGQYGLRNTSASYLFDWASHFYSFGPSISLPIFKGGALVANVALSREQAATATIEYRKAVLTALQEVEDALSALHNDAHISAALRDSVAANERALALAESSYRSGIVSFITVLDSERQTGQTQQQLAQALLQESTDLVKLYKALGGGWETAENR